MGYRADHNIDDDRADMRLRRALERLHERDQVAPPPDLVARAARRLPAVPPAVAARREAARAARRVALRLALAGALALIAALGIAGISGGGQLALLFGDGAGGLSRALLTVRLLAKPLWHSAVAGSPALSIVGLALLAGAAGVWWSLLRRTPIYYTENAP